MDFYFSSLITSHSIFVTHQSSLKIPHHSTQSVFGTIIQLIITQNFQLFVGPIPVTWYNFYFFPSTPSTQIHWTQWKKKKEKEKKEKELSEYQKYYVMKNKKKRKNDLKNNGEERKKEKKRVKSCGWPWLVGPFVCLITKMPLEKRLWNLKTPKSCYWKTWNTDKCWE